MLKLKNTLSGKIEEFKPLENGQVKMYNCGPTVYNFAHIGNLRAYVFADILKKVLKYNGYEVTQVINITDVGHLSDDGLDKIEEQAKKEGKDTKSLSDFYTKKFLEDLEFLNIDTNDTIFPRASEHINEQIALIETLERRGYTYRTSMGVYFNTAEFSNYGKLGNIKITDLKEGARVEKNPEKKNPSDFALWKFPKDGEKRQQEWDSPWGRGFPGWHIECSAMSMKYLGETFDIHTGGIDHIPIHHNNEIAQSESATGKPFVNFWLHNAFLNIKGDKIAKSVGNSITLDHLIKKGFNPLSYRYWLLTASYSTPINFTIEAQSGAQNAYLRLKENVSELPDGGEVDENYRALFKGFVNDDLDTPRALALVWDLLKDEEISPEDKKATIIQFDKILGLELSKDNALEVPHSVKNLVKKREKSREEENWEESDKLRDEIEKLGFLLKDTSSGTKIYPK